jgi:hypothetical protein
MVSEGSGGSIYETIEDLRLAMQSPSIAEIDRVEKARTRCCAMTMDGQRCKGTGGKIHIKEGVSYWLCTYHLDRILIYCPPDGTCRNANGRTTEVKIYSAAQWREKNKGMRAADV